MSMRDVAEVLRRQWQVLTVGLLVAALAGWLVAHPRSTYQAVTVIVLEPPDTPAHPNPLANLSPSLALTAAMVAEWFKSPSGRQQLRQDGVVGEFELTPRNSGTTQTPAYAIPLMKLGVITHNRRTALESLAALVAAFDRKLTALQTEWNVTKADRIMMVVLAPPTATLLRVVRSRILVGVGVLGVAGTIAGALRLDGYLTRRRSGKVPRPAVA